MQKGARGQDQGSVQGEGGGVGNKERTKHAKQRKKTERDIGNALTRATGSGARMPGG